jgi:hypothetical protein
MVSIHEALASRGPAVEPLAEVDIESKNLKERPSGYNFENDQSKITSDRKPAGITSKNPETTSPYSMVGPFIFLLALPFAIWMMISKKLENDNLKSEDKNDYFPKTYQFKPYKTDYQKVDDDDNNDDIDMPKAS